MISTRPRLVLRSPFKLQLLALCVLLSAFFAFAGEAVAQPAFTTATTFTAAESGRTFMTVGGVWNGSSEVTNTTGDTIGVTYTNTGDATAFDFAPNVTLPDGFSYVPGTASVSTSPATPGLGVSASQVGSLLTFTLTPAGYDLPAGTAITLNFGVRVATTVDSGTYQLSHSRNHSLTDDGALVGATTIQQNVLVQAGDTTVNITPKQQLKAVGETANFTITVTNTGLGGLFDVTINESAIHPSGGNLSFVSMTKTAPALAATSSGGGSILTLPYLAPGGVFTADVTALVLSCGSIVNNVTSIHRSDTTPVSDSAPVQLNLLQPLVAYTPPDVVLNYNTPVLVSIPIANTGLGSAYDFTLQSNLNSLPLTVASVASGWTYDDNTGLFTYTAGSGTIADSGSATLSFTVAPENICSASGAGTVVYVANYTNGCGDAYTIPIQTQSIAAAADTPTITLEQTVSAPRIAVAEVGSYTLELSATNIANISDANVVVTHVHASSVTVLDGGLDASGGSASYNAATRTVTWTVPKANLTTPRTLDIDFEVKAEPCNAGTQPNATATTSVDTVQNCTLADSADVSFLISNNPGFSASQYFDVTPGPDGTEFETGNASANLVRDTGEGEFIPFVANYTFGALYPGTWTGSTYEDKFGDVTGMVLVPGSLTVSRDGGAAVPVPPASITTLSPGFRIDLGFLAGSGYFNADPVGGTSITFNYRTTAPDSVILSGGSRSVTQLTNFFLANGGTGSGICNQSAQNRFTQGVFYSLVRAQANVALNLPSLLEVCKDELLTLTVSNANVKDARNVRVTLLNSGTDYAYDTTYTPVYGGAFTSGNITYAANAGTNPTFTYTGNPLTANGTIQVRVRRKANGATTPTALTARVNYDSWQTAAAGANRVYNDTGSYTPGAIRKANLSVIVTPGSLTVTGPTVTYVTYVTNTDAGTAYGAALANTLPPGITLDETATNAANPGYPVSAAGQNLTWSLGNLASGVTVPITVVANVGIIPGCSLAITTERITATWGCDATPFQTVTKIPPSFVFPAGKMQVVHDSTQTVARLCDLGKVVVIVKNTGPTNILGVKVEDIVPPSAGFSISGTVQYRINGGALQNAVSAPGGTGESGSPYTWTSAQIPALAELVPVGVPGANEVRIEFDLAATETLASQSPVLSASASATISCGNAVTSPAQPFTIPVERPVVTVEKTGRNITANPAAAFTDTVYGGYNDYVEWRIVISNTGTATASNLRLSDLLSGSGGAAVINGPGLASDTPVTSGQVLSLPMLAQGDSATYTITEILGNNCLTAARAADISWGCDSNGANVHSDVTTPGVPSSSAMIVMNPVIINGAELTQTIVTTSPTVTGGRARVTVDVTNNGGTAYDPVITATIPAGATFDATAPVTFTSDNVSITGVGVNSTNPNSPVFTFTGVGAATRLLRYGESLSVTYFVRPTVFDTQNATSFTAGTGSNLVSPETALDPTVPATANLTARLDYTNSCGSDFNQSVNTSLNLRTPDLDVFETSPTNRLITGTGAATYTFTIRNSGESGSVADFITLDFPDLGSSWTINSVTLTTAGTGGVAGASASIVGGLHTFTPAQVGTLASGSSVLVTVNAQYSGTPGPLSLKLRARGEARGHDGTTGFGDYSLDQRAQRIIGATVNKVLQSTSEADSSGNTNVLIGEEVTYRISTSFFGSEDDLSSLVINDTPADSNTSAHTGLAYVSHAFTGANEIVPSSVTVNGAPPSPVTAPSGVDDSRIAFNRATLTAADINSGVNTFEADVTVRVLNIAANTDGKSLRNNLGVSFRYLGQTFRSNDADDGFSGGATTTSSLHDAVAVTARRPQLTITKTARNVTRLGTFAATAPGEAGDVIEYRLVVSNPAATAPLYSISVTDTVPAKLNLSASDQGADTNGSDTSIEVANTAGVSGLGASITFNQTNTAIATAGSNFDRLDPGESITLLYRGTLDASVVPNEALVNDADVIGYSLSLPSGGQTAPLGTENTSTGPTRYTATDNATVTIDNIVQQKLIDATSDAASTTPAVFVGEQIRYRVALQLPQGTVPDLQVTDQLPAGLALVSTPVITFGAGISPATQPTIVPATLPADGSPLDISWDFGSRVSSGASVADRTVTIEYVAQVRNIASNVAGTHLVNNAAYSYSGSPVNLNQITVTVAAPSVTVTRGVRNATRNPFGSYVASIAATDAIAPDAGDLIEYQITITNASGANISSAYDFNIQDTLPAGLTYVDGWTGFDTLTNVTPSSFTTFEPSKNGQILTWGRTQSGPVNIDIAPGGTMRFHYRAVVNDTGRPLQNYTNATIVDWTSLDGAGANLGVALAAPGNTLGERIGTGTAPNTYRATGNTPVVARNSTTTTKTKAGDTLPRTAADALGASPDGFRIGDLVTYTVTVPVQEGTMEAFKISDVLPTGMAFVQTVSITPATGANGFTYTTPVAPTTAPAADATGALTWNFGNLVNAGDNNTTNDSLTVVYTARVVDPAGIAVTPVDQTLNNSATTSYTLADASTHTTDASVAAVTARQPRLTLAKDVLSPAIDALGNYVRRPGETASYRLTVANTGTAPAYNVKLTDTLPAGLRATAPVLTAATLNGADVLATLPAATWDNTTGAYVFDLADDELLLPDESLVLTYTVTVDSDDDLKGATLTTSALIDQFFSLPSAHPEAASRRQYASVGPATRPLVIGLRIDGFVYHDVDLSNARDGAEDWSGLKPTVFANLVAPNSGDSLVFRTVTVAPGTGAFVFDYLPPGDFTVILTDSAGKLVAQRPANWLNQNPATGSIAATINQGTGDLVNQNLGLNQGAYALTVAPTITKTKSGDTLPTTAPAAGFRIGDLITYTVDVFPHEGVHSDFTVTDVLPPGLIFVNTVSIAQVSGASRYTYTTPVAGTTAPAANAEGTISWDFGTFTNAIADPANNTLRITYRARVRNIGADNIPAPAVAPAVTTVTRDNSATLGYTNATVSADPIAAGPSVTTVTIEQPRLTLAKVRTSPTPDNLVVPGGTATYKITVTNDGTAPAYNTRVTDTLPVGMRGAAPSGLTVTLNGLPATVTPVWTVAAGTYVFNLSNTQLLQPGQSLVLTYTVTVDAAATRGATLTNSAVVNRFFSKPSNDTTHRRQYVAVGPATADVVVGMAVSGHVYSDLQPNDVKDGLEDWTGAGEPTVYVNLLDDLGAVVSSATVNPGAGAYAFTNLPAGDYSLVLTDSAINTTAARPVNWPFQFPATGTRAFTLSNADLPAQDFGLYQGTLAAASITKSKSGDTLPLSAPAAGFRIGDVVTYTVDIQPQEGVFTDFIVTDELPAGLAFIATTSIAQVSGPDRFTYTTPAGVNAPAADATGTLTWTFGNFENELLGPADNTLRITYTARVLDTAGVSVPAVSPASTTTARVNSAQLDYVNADLDPLTAGPASASLDIEQPRLTLAKTRVAPVADNIVMPGGAATFRLTVTNNGTAPAYNVALADTLPAGLRTATPSLDAATLNGVDVLGTLAAPTYTAGTGLWSVALTDTEILLPGETLVLDYTVTVDADATQGATLTNSATITAYASKPSADTPHRRVYSPVGPSTQNLIVGLNVAGSVYHELIPNDLKDASEDWTTGTPVVVNLVANTPIALPGYVRAADQVVRSLAVPVGTGDFTFTHVPPGNYRIVVADTASATAPVVPATWTFDTPSTGSLTPVAVTNTDLADQDLGLYQGRVVSGVVYHDLATYGAKDPGEDWTGAGEPTVVVNLVNVFGTPVVHASLTVPAGTGAYSFTNVPPGSYQLIVAPAGQTTATTATAPTNWVFVQPETGALGTLTLTTTDIVDQDFGLTPGRTVSGYVFNDTNPNGAKDGFEDWLTGTPTIVNLVRVSTGTVFASANVNIGDGEFTFTNVPPGAFRIIVTNTSGSTAAAVPATWIFRNPSDGGILINVAASDFTEQNFALFRGRTLSGRVFHDTGVGGGTGNDGRRNGSESGIGNVTVRLLSAGLSVLDTARTDGGGNFVLRIPTTVAAGDTLIVEEIDPPAHHSTGGYAGTTGGAYNRATDRLTFTYADDDPTGVEFGDVPESIFNTDGAQTIPPGAVAFYRHTFVAGTAGTVSFSTTNSANPAGVPWTQVILRSDAAGTPGALVLPTTTLTVEAGEEVYLLLKDTSSPGAPFGSVNTTIITATFTYANASPGILSTHTRQDVTTIGTTTAAGLTLVKAVDKTTAQPGDILTYTITYTNNGASPLTDLFIDDRTPHYTVLAEQIVTETLPNSLTAVTITQPANNEAGVIRWDFTGELDAGATGTVTFKVKVE